MPSAVQYRFRVSTTPTRSAGTCVVSSGMPSSPPVRPPGLRRISTEPACANASVTIANEIPVTRSASDPTVAASTRPTTSVIPMETTKITGLGQSDGPNASSVIASPYAPAAKKSAWPNESRPARPNIMR
jgi:hypothetical protein